MDRRGDQVVLTIDANEALQKNTKGSFRRRMEDIGMNELILNHHPHLKPPSTRSPGTNTIDSIFGTGSLIVRKACYGPFVGYSDHRLAWVDIDWHSALGIFQKIQRPIARRLQCDDLRSVKKYLKVLTSLLDEADVDLAISLEKDASIPLSKNDAILYEELDRKITRCMKMAENFSENYLWVGYRTLLH